MSPRVSRAASASGYGRPLVRSAAIAGTAGAAFFPERRASSRPARTTSRSGDLSLATDAAERGGSPGMASGSAPFGGLPGAAPASRGAHAANAVAAQGNPDHRPSHDVHLVTPRCCGTYHGGVWFAQFTPYAPSTIDIDLDRRPSTPAYPSDSLSTVLQKALAPSLVSPMTITRLVATLSAVAIASARIIDGRSASSPNSIASATRTSGVSQ